MPFTLKDLDENPRLIRDLRTEQPHCCGCGVLLQETLTGKNPTPKGEACCNCYYDKLGEEIEQHPLGSAGIRRG